MVAHDVVRLIVKTVNVSDRSSGTTTSEYNLDVMLLLDGCRACAIERVDLVTINVGTPDETDVILLMPNYDREHAVEELIGGSEW